MLGLWECLVGALAVGVFHLLRKHHKEQQNTVSIIYTFYLYESLLRGKLQLKSKYKNKQREERKLKFNFQFSIFRAFRCKSILRLGIDILICCSFDWFQINIIISFFR